MITLEEIAGYLPYGLKVLSIKPDWQTTFEMDTYSNMRGSGIEKRDIHSVISNQYKPVLRPLSDLTREIEHNGEKFVPIEKLLGITESDRNEVEIKFVVPKLKSLSRWEIYVHSPDPESSSKEWVENIPLNTYSWPFNKIQKLYSWHFDIHGLIKRGDAIDINSLT